MRTPILPALVLAAFGAAGCGSVTLDCEAMCKKSIECDSTQTLANCMSACATANQVGNGSYLSAIQGCFDKSCNDIGKCATDAIQSCDGDPEPLYDDYCTKMNSCDSSIPVDFCKAAFSTGAAMEASKYVKCINDATLSKVSSCVQQASCDKFTEESQKCFENVLSTSDATAQSGGN